ncbi:MAG: hypothetical protein ACI8Q1_002017 [Parvicella sp.]|jgi:hypothetical protein
MHKTGSTSLQYFLSSQRERLNEFLIDYPRTKNALCHHDDLLNLRFESTYKLKSVLRRLKKSGIKKVIFSAEAVSVLNEQETQRLHNCLKQFGDVRYILVLRDWRSYLPSRYQQNCKRKDTQTFPEYLDRLVDHNTYHHDIYYETIIKKYLNINAHLRVVSFDNAVQTNGLILEFIRVLELHNKVSFEKPYKLNERWSLLRTEITRITNGLLANHLKIPQNELFTAIANNKRIKETFDLSLHAKTYDNELRPFEELVDESIRIYQQFPLEISNHYETLNKKYLDIFINLKNGQLFDNHSTSNLQIKYSDLTWDGFQKSYPIESKYLLRLGLSMFEAKSNSSRPWKTLNPLRNLIKL